LERLILVNFRNANQPVLEGYKTIKVEYNSIGDEATLHVKQEDIVKGTCEALVRLKFIQWSDGKLLAKTLSTGQMITFESCETIEGMLDEV